MAIKKVQLIPPGYTDIIHPETEGSMVKMASGNTIETDFTTHSGNTTVHITSAERTAWNAKSDLATTYTKSETDTRIQSVIGSAPLALDTLKELADALGNDASFASTVTTSLGNKVDKIAGKGLSTNDYTNADVTKLAGIATSANNYVHPTGNGNLHVPGNTASLGSFLQSGTEGDIYWNEIGRATVGLSNVDNTSDALKPISTSTQTALNLKLDATHVGTGGTTHAVATQTVNGFISSADKTKLDNVATNANNYVHPSADGSLHVPATSTTNNGKALLAGATAGSLAWTALTKTNVGLTNVDNTADASKPVSTAQQTALNLKLNATHAGTGDTAHALVTTTVSGFMSGSDKVKLNGVDTGANNYVHPTGDGNLHVPTTADILGGIGTLRSGITGDIYWSILNASDVGLGNVSNTSDASKPVSTAQQTALDLKLNATHAGTTGTAHGNATGVVAGFMTSADFTKLAGVATSANNYTHPANHPASVITQDASNRFVSDAEKTLWNSSTSITLSTIQPVGGWWFKEVV